MSNWYKEHTITVEGLKVANYMIDYGSEMIGVENIPDLLSDAKMIFRSENVHTVYDQAISQNLPELSDYEAERIEAMLVLLICVKIQEDAL